MPICYDVNRWLFYAFLRPSYHPFIRSWYTFNLFYSFCNVALSIGTKLNIHAQNGRISLFLIPCAQYFFAFKSSVHLLLIKSGVFFGSEIDQLYKICCVLGAPDWNAFPEARNLSGLVNISYSEVCFEFGLMVGVLSPLSRTKFCFSLFLVDYSCQSLTYYSQCEFGSYWFDQGGYCCIWSFFFTVNVLDDFQYLILFSTVVATLFVGPTKEADCRSMLTTFIFPCNICSQVCQQWLLKRFLNHLTCANDRLTWGFLVHLGIRCSWS